MMVHYEDACGPQKIAPLMAVHATQFELIPAPKIASWSSDPNQFNNRKDKERDRFQANSGE